MNVLTNDTDPENDINASSVNFDPASVPGSTGTDTDGDGDIDQVVVPGEGTWTVDDAGVVTFTPEAGFTADPTPINYTVTDDTGKVSNPATVTIDYTQTPDISITKISTVGGTGIIGDTISYELNVTNTGNVPLTNVTVTDANATITGGPIDLAVGASDSTTFTATHVITAADVAAGGVTNQAVATGTAPDGNTITDNSDDPTNGTNTDPDGDGDPDDPTVTVLTNPPVANNDTKAGTVGTPTTVNVLTNDTDPENDINASSVNFDPASVPGSTGTDTDGDGDIDQVVVPGEGTWTVDDAGVVTFTPEAGFTADPTPINYTVTDDTGKVSNPATVTVDYPQTLEAKDDNATGTTGNPVTLDVVGNDTGENPLDPTTVKIIDPNNPGTPVTELTVPGEGVWTVDPVTGKITFTPETGFTGDPTPIKYTVEDDQGNVSSPATVTVDYPQTLEAKDDNATGTTGNPVTLDVVGNDTGDNPLDPTTVKIIDPDTNASITQLVVPEEGEWVVDLVSGDITFTPEAGFTGNPAPIQYTVADDQGEVSNLATVTVTYEQDVPTAVDDPSVSITHYGPTIINVLANDTFGLDGPNVGEITITAQPQYGTVVLDNGGTPDDPTDDKFIYTPEANVANVTDTFEYLITDANGDTSRAIVTLKVDCSSTQKSDSGDTLGIIGILMMLFMTGMTGLYFIRKEEEKKGEA